MPGYNNPAVMTPQLNPALQNRAVSGVPQLRAPGAPMGVATPPPSGPQVLSTGPGMVRPPQGIPQTMSAPPGGSPAVARAPQLGPQTLGAPHEMPAPPARPQMAPPSGVLSRLSELGSRMQFPGAGGGPAGAMAQAMAAARRGDMAPDEGRLAARGGEAVRRGGPGPSEPGAAGLLARQAMGRQMLRRGGMRPGRHLGRR